MWSFSSERPQESHQSGKQAACVGRITLPNFDDLPPAAPQFRDIATVALNVA